MKNAPILFSPVFHVSAVYVLGIGLTYQIKHGLIRGGGQGSQRNRLFNAEYSRFSGPSEQEA